LKMTQPKLTEEGLPVLSKETMDSLIDIISRSNHPIVGTLQERLERDQPELAEFLELGRDYGNRDYGRGIIFGVNILYAALRQQAAANKLGQEVNGLGNTP
ncbi:MAG: hypothetical protein Q8L27_00415, partial [archaeon]|nr:hypothetical protein [archaeon]